MALALGSQREMTAEFSREKGEPGLMDYLSKPVLLIEQKWRKRKAILFLRSELHRASWVSRIMSA